MIVWQHKPLGEVARIVSGATPRSAVPEYWNGSILWATPADLSGLTGPYLSTTPRKISDAGLASCAASLLPAGSVLFSSRAPIGHVAINTLPMATNQGFKSFVPGPDLDAKYLYHWLKYSRAYLESLGNGATFKEVSKAVVERVELPTPPVDEQRRIAAILDQADALRAKRREVLAHLDTLPRALFHHMFGRETTRVRLGEVITEGPTNGVYRPLSDYGSGTPIVRIDAFDAGRMRLAGLKRLRLEPEERARYALAEGDILINRVNALSHLGKSVLIRDLGEETVFESNMMRVRVNPSAASPQFVHGWLQTADAKRQILGRAKKAINQASINQSDVRGLEMPAASSGDQTALSAALESQSAARRRAQVMVEKADALFHSLQSRAFKGEL